MSWREETCGGSGTGPVAPPVGERDSQELAHSTLRRPATRGREGEMDGWRQGQRDGGRKEAGGEGRKEGGREGGKQ